MIRFSAPVLFHHMRIILPVVLAATPFSVSAQNSYQDREVQGWARSANLESVTIYNADGDEIEQKNMRGSSIHGRLAFDPRLEIVHIGSGKWVDAKLLNMRIICQRVVTSPVQGKSPSQTSGTYGSGNGC